MVIEGQSWRLRVTTFVPSSLSIDISVYIGKVDVCMFVAFSTETTPSGGIVVASYDVAAKNENCFKRSSSHPMTLQQENEISKY